MLVFVFFNDTATTEIYTLSLHDALPILKSWAALHNRMDDMKEQTNPELPTLMPWRVMNAAPANRFIFERNPYYHRVDRSEEHTSELQSRQYLVCRLLLEKKKIATPASL